MTVFTPSEKAYLQTWLNQVSRSFAVVIPYMEAPLDGYMSIAYLIARVVDSIEDCEQPFAWKAARFAEFHQLLAHPELRVDILSAWGALDWLGLTPAEQELMSLAGGGPLWELYARLPAPTQESLRRWLGEMALGMERTLDPAQSPSMIHTHGVQILARPEDYNQYCYYVAGTVGNLGTELAHQHYHFPPESLETLRLLSETCGRALQKTNIIKDFLKDLRRGVCFLPDTWLREVNYLPLSLAGASKEWTYKVVMDAVHELAPSFEYVRRLPQYALGYRVSSLVCLLPAYQVMLLAARRHAQLFTDHHLLKISRLTFFRCMHQASQMRQDNAAVDRYGEKTLAIARAFA